MHLFNDTSQKHDTSFILNCPEWGKSKTEGEREKERIRVKNEKQRKGMGHKLTVKYL
jgi:hypothetical protein